MAQVCQICKYPANEIRIGNDQYSIECIRCGEYKITGSDIVNVGSFLHDDPEQIANMSGWIREHNDQTITRDILVHIIPLKTPSVPEKADKLLQYAANTLPQPGAYIDVGGIAQLDGTIKLIQMGRYASLPDDLKSPADRLLPLLSVAWAQNNIELYYYLFDYLSETKDYLAPLQGSPYKLKITPEGWAYLNSLRFVNPDSHLGFVAMYFKEELNPVFENAIAPGILAAGYEPKRIDRHEHVNRIDDEIIALIRQSRFVVADFTRQRRGVYFESGYALGLGLPVIWLCKKWRTARQKPHFDVRQYNFILWEDDKLDELKSRITHRIVKVLGQGACRPE